MLDYRMSTIIADADENVVELIANELKEEGYKFSKLKLSFVGFEAPAGTAFFLNNQEKPMKVPSSGKFVTPYNGEQGMAITSLKFATGFTGDIYYIK